MSDDLAAQLVGAAAEAIRDVDVDRGMIGASDEEMARAAVVAALRTLADAHKGDLNLYKMISGKRFVEWAARIEQGDGK